MEPDSSTHTCFFVSPNPDHLPKVAISIALRSTDGWLATKSGGFLASYLTVHGRKTVLHGDDNDTASGEPSVLCRGETGVLSWDVWPGRMPYGGDLEQSRGTDLDTSEYSPGLSEVATIVINTPTSWPTDKCTTALEMLMAEVWPQLPPPSQPDS